MQFIAFKMVSGMRLYRDYMVGTYIHDMTRIFYKYVGIRQVRHSRGTRVGDMLTLAPERYTAGLCMVTKVIP